MRRGRRLRPGGRPATTVVLALATALLLLGISLAAAGCGGERPPALDATQVVDLAVDSVHPGGSPDAIMAAYNRAKPADFNTETTPELEVLLAFRDGSTVALMFSPLFPRDGVYVAVTPPSAGGAAGMVASIWYKLKAPGLLDAVLALAGDDHGARVMREQR